jgi:hypothetical protein
MSHMSSNDDQPVTPTRVRYWVGLTGDSGFEVECTDFREDAGYMRFMDGPIPVGLVPLQNFRCAHRLEPKP